MANLIRILLLIVAVINILFAAVAIAQPRRAASWIGFELSGAGALGEMRAVYGGLVAVVAILIVVAVWMESGASLLVPLALVFGGLVIGRVVSLVIDGFSWYSIAAGIFELCAAGLLWAAWWRSDGL